MNRNIVGKITKLEDGFITGWAYDEASPDESIELDIISENTPQKTIPTCFFSSEGGREGYHGFKARIDDISSPDIEVRVKDTDIIIPNDNSPSAGTQTNNFDSVNGFIATGWAINCGDVNIPAQIDIFIDDKKVAKIEAIMFRKDLEEENIGSACHGFKYAIPEKFFDGMEHKISIKNKGKELNDSPKYFSISPYNEKLKNKNFIKNGNFSSWKKGLSFNIRKKIQEVADGWYIQRSAKEKTSVIARCVEVEDSHEYALSLKADKIEKYVRIRTDFFLPSIVSDYKLSFLSKSNDTEASIASIKLINKSEEAEATAHVIASNAAISKNWELNEFIIPKIFTKELLNLDLSLCFEFHNPIDICISDMKLQPISPSEIYNTFFGFEDKNISDQLDDIGLGEWKIPPIKTSDIMEDYGDEIAKWRRNDKTPSIDIITCVYNGLPYVKRCLNSIISKTTIPYMLTIVDDGSDNETKSFLEEFCNNKPFVKLITNRKNLGYTKSANKGLNNASSDWVILINSDTEVSDGWLEGMLECSASDKNIGLVGPLSNAATWQSIPERFDDSGNWAINNIPSSISIDDFAQIIKNNSKKSFPKAPLLNGFCIMVKKEVIERIGVFDEKAFPMGYGEENDYCIRAGKNFKLAIADNSYVYHHKSKSFGHKRRKTLSKEGGKALLKKHPELNLEKLTDKLKNEKSLRDLRENIKKELEKMENA